MKNIENIKNKEPMNSYRKYLKGEKVNFEEKKGI